LTLVVAEEHLCYNYI